MAGLKGSLRLAAMVAALSFGLLAVSAALAQLPPGGTFVDDDGNVHEADIEAIAAAGITKGCNPPANDLYCPDDQVTRGQMAAFLNRALPLPATAEDFFVDDDGSVFEPDIDKLATAGVTVGCNPPVNDMYCPGDPVSRDQMASFLTRALGLDPIPPPPPTDGTTSTTDGDTTSTSNGTTSTSNGGTTSTSNGTTSTSNGD